MTGEGLDEIRGYLRMDDDLLLEELGDLLLGEGPGFGGPSDREARQDFARAWVTRKTDEFRRDLCGDAWSKMRRHPSLDALEDVAIVADALAAALGQPMANLVAVILIRRGLDTICD